MKRIFCLIFIITFSSFSQPNYEQLLMQAVPNDNIDGFQEQILSTILDPQDDKLCHRVAKLRIAIEYGRHEWVEYLTGCLFISKTQFQDGKTPMQLIQEIRDDAYVPRKTTNPAVVRIMYRTILLAETIEILRLNELDIAQKTDERFRE